MAKIVTIGIHDIMKYQKSVSIKFSGIAMSNQRFFFNKLENLSQLKDEETEFHHILIKMNANFKSEGKNDRHL
jgi:hypothetical protein